jgi:ribosome-interacting GTPase 1
MEEVEAIARQPTSIPISCTQELNLDTLLEMLWEQMGLVRALLVPKTLLCPSPGAPALYPHYGKCLGV